MVLGRCGNWTLVVGRLIDSLLFRERERESMSDEERENKIKY